MLNRRPPILSVPINNTVNIRRATLKGMTEHIFPRGKGWWLRS